MGEQLADRSSSKGSSKLGYIRLAGSHYWSLPELHFSASSLQSFHKWLGCRLGILSKFAEGTTEFGAAVDSLKGGGSLQRS